jgi:hypothetical protein
MTISPATRPGPAAASPARIVAPPHRGPKHIETGWPLTALLCLFPLWWALGLSTFIFPILAVPMAWYLVKHRPVRLPPGFAIWLLFLVWMVASLVMLPSDPPGTIAGTVVGRAISVMVNLAEFAGVTITLLYVGNLSPRIATQRRIVGMLGILFFSAVVGGMLGVFAPTLSFTSPIELLLPGSLRADPYIQSITHPSVAQVMTVLGYETPRPSAPFGYTNFWGNNLSLLMVWFAAGWWAMALRGGRAVAIAGAAVAMVPIVYSLNRGLWLGIALSAVYLVVRLAVHGHVGALAVTTGVAVIGVLVFVATPLQGMVMSRFEHGHSDNVRSYLNARALDGAKESPVLGYGGTRKTMGSDQSITVGKTPKCPQCGNFAIGSTGQLWSLLFSHGFVGTGLFLGFFAYSGWRYRRDRTPIGYAGTLVIGLTFVYMFFYNSVPAALTITMISVALLWRNEMIHRGLLPDAPAPLPAPVLRRHRATG